METIEGVGSGGGGTGSGVGVTTSTAKISGSTATTTITTNSNNNSSNNGGLLVLGTGGSQTSSILNAADCRPETLTYYFGNISRETAEWILWESGCDDGLFLVRDSGPDFVLSLCHNKSILHYRISKLTDDPQNSVMLHGLPAQKFATLPALIAHVDGLATSPTLPCDKEVFLAGNPQLPPTHWGVSMEDIRLAVIQKAREWDIDLMLLPNELVSSMNPQGYQPQTTFTHHIHHHIHHHQRASSSTNAAVSKAATMGRATWSTAVTMGKAAMSAAATMGRAAKAAATTGSNVPFSPMNSTIMTTATPTTTAPTTSSTVTTTNSTTVATIGSILNQSHHQMTINHVELELIKSLISKTLHEIQPWFHGRLSRLEAEYRIQQQAQGGAPRDGLFLIRERDDSSYVLCLWHDSCVKHYRIDVLPSQQFAIQHATPFPSLIALISHYTLNSDGLWCALTDPCPRPGLSAATECHHNTTQQLTGTTPGSGVVVALSSSSTPATMAFTTLSNTNANNTANNNNHLVTCQSLATTGGAQVAGQAHKVTIDNLYEKTERSSVGGAGGHLAANRANALHSENNNKIKCALLMMETAAVVHHQHHHQGELDPTAAGLTHAAVLTSRANYYTTGTCAPATTTEATIIVGNGITKVNDSAITSEGKIDGAGGDNKVAPLKATDSEGKPVINDILKEFDVHYNGDEAEEEDGSETPSPGDEGGNKIDSLLSLFDPLSGSLVAGAPGKSPTEPPPPPPSGGITAAAMIECMAATLTPVKVAAVDNPCYEYDTTSSSSASSSMSTSSVSQSTPKPGHNCGLTTAADLILSPPPPPLPPSGPPHGSTTGSSSIVLSSLSTITTSTTTTVTSSSKSSAVTTVAVTGTTTAVTGTGTGTRATPPIKLNHADLVSLEMEALDAGYREVIKHRRGPLFIDPKFITIKKRIGCGYFGEVFLASMPSTSPDGRQLGQIDLALKMLKSTMVPNQKTEILQEAAVMSCLDHKHIVRLLGAAEANPLMLVMELCPLGPLNDFLQSGGPTVMSIPDILLLMLQVAKAMQYLEEKSFIHRDLAARNVLLVNEKFAKVSDFGMSRALGIGKEYYKARSASKWPLKWYAPECIYYFKFSSKSDVWSYGVTLWEALTYGEKPYSGMDGQDILRMFRENRRLAQPANCPQPIYTLMRACWNFRPEDRPHFKEIGVILTEHLMDVIQVKPPPTPAQLPNHQIQSSPVLN